MKIRIVTHEDEKIIVKHTIIKLGVNTFDTEGSKVPISLFKDKGDILAAKDANNPATIKVGSDGQVLVSDSNEEAGVKWQTIKFGTISLLNSESFTVPSGMAVTPGTESGTFRVATSVDTENLYVTSENILSGKYGVIYATNGVSCSVRVTEGAIAIGDKLAVSAIDGIAQATTGDHFAIAVTGKNAGQIGVVSCILVNSNSTTLDVTGGGTGRQTLTSNNILVGNGVDPVKLISTLPIAQGGTGATTAEGARTNLGILDIVYPVGSIYMSVNSTNPGTFFGGTWVAWGAGRVPVGFDSSQSEFDTVEKTGGEKTHTLTETELPEITGSFGDIVMGGHGNFRSGHFISTGQLWGSATYPIASGSMTTTPWSWTFAFGGGGSHNNLQPYIVCYMWKRTA